MQDDKKMKNEGREARRGEIEDRRRGGDLCGDGQTVFKD